MLMGGGSCIMMGGTVGGVCGISAVAHNPIGRAACFSPLQIRARKTGVLPFHAFGRMQAHCSFPSLGIVHRALSSSDSKGWKGVYSFARECGSWRNVKDGRRKGMSRIRAAGNEEKVGYKGYPPMQTKPKWYWRLLASFPYLVSFHVVWVFSETVYSIHPFLEDFEFFTYPFLVNGLGRLPDWFFTAYFFGGYLGVVRNNKFPHFLRFHMINGMLLEILFSVCGQINDWVPKSFYWGKLGQLFWCFVSFSFLFTVFICILCALKGWYADVPFISDAAYMQMPY